MTEGKKEVKYFFVWEKKVILKVTKNLAKLLNVKEPLL